MVHGDLNATDSLFGIRVIMHGPGMPKDLGIVAGTTAKHPECNMGTSVPGEQAPGERLVQRTIKFMCHLRSGQEEYKMHVPGRAT